MRSRAILMLGLAILFGALSIILARQWINRQVAAPPVVEVPTKSVVVAAVALNFGDRLTPGGLREAQWPQNIVPAGTFEHISDLTGDAEPRVVLRAIDAGEPILATKVTGKGGRASLSTLIEKDMRAYTIRVNEVTGTAGWVLPNDRVDVLLTRRPEGAPEPITDVLLQNVKVLAIDQEANEKRDKPAVARAVTLLVTQEQAQKLTLAADVGTINLALRSDTDTTALNARTIGVNDLRVGEANNPALPPAPVAQAPAPAPPPPAVPAVVRPIAGGDEGISVEVIRGLQSHTIHVSPDAGAPPPPPSARSGSSSSRPSGQNARRAGG